MGGVDVGASRLDSFTARGIRVPDMKFVRPSGFLGDELSLAPRTDTTI